jgi:hypothetical protein
VTSLVCQDVGELTTFQKLSRFSTRKAYADTEGSKQMLPIGPRELKQSTPEIGFALSTSSTKLQPRRAGYNPDIIGVRFGLNSTFSVTILPS